MALLPIVTGVDNAILRTPSKVVKKIDKKIKKLVSDMIDTMVAAPGVGIAAPQIGVNLRIYIARLNPDTPQETIVPMINPRFLQISEEKEEGEEGCLSLPKRFGMVPRALEVTVEYQNIKGTKTVLRLDGFNAKIMQHEMDHLDATLIADKMTRVTKS